MFISLLLCYDVRLFADGQWLRDAITFVKRQHHAMGREARIAVSDITSFLFCFILYISVLDSMSINVLCKLTLY